MKYLGTTKFNRNARFNSIGAGKYGGTSLNEVRIDTTMTDIITAIHASELEANQLY
jgi:hypothetical protein